MQSLSALIATDMPLRKDQQDFIREEIDRQLKGVTDSFRPHGWRKVASVIRQLGPTITFVGVIVAIIGITLGALYQTFGHVREETEFRTHTNDTLKEMQDGIKEIRASIEGMKLKQIGSNPENPKSIAEAKNILTSAASAGVKIDPNVVKDVGGQFLAAAQRTPSVWSSALLFINYRSFLNPLPSVLGRLEAVPNFTTHYDGHNIENREEKGGIPKVRVQMANLTTPPNLAQYRPITGPDQNADSPSGPGYLVITGAVMSLDGYFMKNIVIVNSRVAYSGGPVVLQNVTFVNCTFDLTAQPTGVRLADALLTSSATDFTA